MVYKKIKDKQGNYKTSRNVRYTVLEVNEAYTPEGLNVGWDTFDNLEAALEAYKLTYDPLSEEILEDK